MCTLSPWKNWVIFPLQVKNVGKKTHPHFPKFGTLPEPENPCARSLAYYVHACGGRSFRWRFKQKMQTIENFWSASRFSPKTRVRQELLSLIENWVRKVEARLGLVGIGASCARYTKFYSAASLLVCGGWVFFPSKSSGFFPLLTI